MRKLLFAQVKADLQPTEVGARFWHRGALGTRAEIPADPQLPYVLYGELPSQPFQVVNETSRATAHYFQLWVYDKPGSIVRIDSLMDVMRETVRGLTEQVSPSGARCLEAVWQGVSQDFTDQSEKKAIRFATVKLVGTS